ncbi:hypothetical protein LAZ67_13000992 [Cordylochernes scorpioides]|uniref:Mos1 transposase HTH domain-containing protein n=1 Tax=Cordylochernes scorpioides TaxID=51811 RepID=A0ABY6L5B9_9ARAC|nr:hypothetical protein LAZ67_13000992 [Cordylochernes scorpioides]
MKENSKNILKSLKDEDFQSDFACSIYQTALTLAAILNSEEINIFRVIIHGMKYLSIFHQIPKLQFIFVGYIGYLDPLRTGMREKGSWLKNEVDEGQPKRSIFSIPDTRTTTFGMKVSFTETLALMNEAYEDEKLSRTQSYFWYKRFKDGRKSIADDSRSGRPLTSTTDRNIGQVRDLIIAERKITIDNISEIFGISYGSFQNIIGEHLNI